MFLLIFAFFSWRLRHCILELRGLDAGYAVTGLNLAQRDVARSALRCGIRATLCKPTAGLGVDWGRKLALERDLVHFDPRIRDRNGGQQRLCVGMYRRTEELLCISDLHDLPQIHNHDLVGQMLDNAQIVGNKQIGKPHFLLNILHQV